jgi:hypothetical protein
LIPSCPTCNGFEAKGNACPIKKGITSPYEMADSNCFKFTYKVATIDALRPLADKSAVSVKLKKMIDGNNEIFKLARLYELHADHVLELIVKSNGRYPDAFRKYLKTYTGLKFDNVELGRLILGNYVAEDELHKRPLAKLYRDIGLELGIIS